MLQNLNAFVAYSALAELVITEGTVFRRPFSPYQLHRHGGSRVTAVYCTAHQQILPSVGETCPPGPPAHMHGEVFQGRVSQESRKRSELSFRN